MSKTKKQRLAEYVMSHEGRLYAKGMMEYSNSQDLGVQVKTINSNGDFVIKLSANDLWLSPVEWLHNYKTTVKQRYEEARKIYESLFPPEDTDNSNLERKVRRAVVDYDRLLTALALEPEEDGVLTRYVFNDDLSRRRGTNEYIVSECSNYFKLKRRLKGWIHLGCLLSSQIKNFDDANFG